ncbi:MAG: NgoFVII family restriction endonuclease [Clostridia bacterium]|nr:NgoFVII family restriction endonuclease [Clostridia bacterium]
MKIINNISSNHNIAIQNILYSADQLILISPFLTEDFDEFIHDVSIIGIKKVTLITTLKNNSPELFSKANTVYSFCIACMLNNILHEIRIDNLLHGKLYIALKNDVPVAGIITSANFTVRGLTVNHEWGIEIYDPIILQNIVNDIYNVSSDPLSQKELDAIVKEIDDFLLVNPQVKEIKPVLDVTQYIKKKLGLNMSSNNFDIGVRYFLKPIGSAEEPFDEKRVFDPGIIEMRFSRRRPNSVRKGDVLICYGVGTTKLLGYFKVISDPYFDDSNSQRWPWKVETQNLSPTYGLTWVTKSNTLNHVKNIYGDDKILTYVGGKSFGALQFGADKVQLNDDFAKFLIELIDK